MIVATYRSFIAGLTAGVQWAQQYLGQRYMGTVGLLGDLVAEGARQTFLQRLPGSPDQAEDSLNQSGADAGLFRYRGESLSSWRARVGDPWEQHEQSGSDRDLLREVDVWGSIVYPSTWVDGVSYLLEASNGSFYLLIPAGLLPWTGPHAYDDGGLVYDGIGSYDDGSTYDDAAIKYDDPTLLFDVRGNPEDVATLRAILKRFRPARSKYTIIVPVTGIVYDEVGVTYDGGSIYDGTVIRI